MSDEGLHDRVTRLLADAEEHLERLDDDADEASEDADAALREVAAETSDLLSETDAGDLMEAISSESIPEDERPDSLPEALAQSGEEEVVTLRRLVALAKTDDADEDSLAERRDELRDLIGLGEDADESEDGTDDRSEQAGDESEEEESGGTSFEDALRDTLDTLRDEMGEAAPEAPDGVAGASGSDEDDEDEEDEEEDDESDEDDESGTSRSVDGTMMSTMPSRDRRDVGGGPRVSNVRKKR